MRLWHKELIPVLPRQQLLGQWRECCLIAKNIAEKGTPGHILVNKIMEYPIGHFVEYTRLVIAEMVKREYKVEPERFYGWIAATDYIPEHVDYLAVFAGWHNLRYFVQCYFNLQEKYDCGGISVGEWAEVFEACTVMVDNYCCGNAVFDWGDSE